MSARLTSYVAGCSALLLALCTSCNLVDLSSRITQAGCKFDAECEILNTAENPDFIYCRPFQCSAEHVCAPARRDLDHDGFTIKECIDDPAQGDCNDLVPNIHPHAAESCDDADNDCDDRIDEGVLVTERSTALDFGSAAPVSDLVYAYDLARHQLALSYAVDSPATRVALNRIELDPSTVASAMTPISFGSPPRPLHADAASVGVLPLRGTVITAYSSDEPQRLLFGALDGTGAVVSFGGGAVYGLSCATDEACAANSGSPTPAIAAPFSEAPALATGPDGMLVVYARNPERATSLCQIGQPPAAKRLLGNMLASAGMMGVVERTRAAVAIGQSFDSQPPAVLGIEAQTTNGQGYGWLVAYPDTDGILQIVRVSFAFQTLVVSEPLLKIGGASGALHAPRLVLGQVNEGRIKVGLSAERGCGSDSQIVFTQLEATLASDASVSLRRLSKLRELGGAAGQHAASLAYKQGQHSSWALAYRDAAGLRARLLTEDGIPTGDAPYLLDEDPTSSEPAPATALISQDVEHTWFSVFAYAAADGDTPARLMRTNLNSCAMPIIRR